MPKALKSPSCSPVGTIVVYNDEHRYSIYFLVWQKPFTRLILMLLSDTRLLCWFLSTLPSQKITLSAASVGYLPAVSCFATHLYPWLCVCVSILLLKRPHAFHLGMLKQRGGVPSQQWGLTEVHVLIILPQSCTSGRSEEACNSAYGHRWTLFGTGLQSLVC